MQVFEREGSPYSHKTLSAISPKRMGGSDLIEIKYTYTDPGICQNTLEFLNDIFAKTLLEIKLSQTNDVVEYFQEQTEAAREELTIAEQKLEDFRIENKIINYDQQTLNIAGMQSQLEQQYQEELRNRAAAKSRVDQLEEKVELNKQMIKFNDEMLAKKNRLSTINSKIAELEVYYNDQKKLNELKTEASRLEAELQNNLSNRYQYSKTPDGVSGNSILQQWLAATLELDASQARLSVLANRNNYFQNQYNQFSPLGSELGRLERGVKVAEKQYLEMTNSLNMAITRQQSESLSSGGLAVLVPPKFPIEPLESKQLLLVLIAAVVGFIIPFVFLVVIEFLDNTVRTPIRGEEVTGLTLLGAYPDLTPKSEYKNVDMEWLETRAIGHLTQNLRQATRVRETAERVEAIRNILVFSTREREGKGLMTHLMANELSRLDYDVMVLSNDEFEISDERGYRFVNYAHNKSFLKTRNINDLLPAGLRTEDFDYVFLEIKGVLSEQYPLALVEQFDFAICALSAKRPWNKADTFALTEFQKNMKSGAPAPRLLVNAVEPDYMDSVLGEISKQRSFLRKFIKAVLTLQFRNRKGLETKSI